jgi:hypothetical protein
MNYLFPGMDPYLEHPVLWESVHKRLIVALANQLQPMLDPRYVAAVEERVFIEGPQRRIPDLWVQRFPGETPESAARPQAGDAAVILEVEELELRQSRVEILDAYNDMKLVTLVEVVSPTNKTSGPGRRSYRAKQKETIARDCHLVEIDLLRRGKHVMCVPEWRTEVLKPYDSLVCVNRWPERSRYELYPRGLRQRLARINLPLAAPDPDVPLDLQAAVEQVYHEGRYLRRIRYGEPCEPPLSEDDQRWADERWAVSRRARPDLFPPADA